MTRIGALRGDNFTSHWLSTPRSHVCAWIQNATCGPGLGELDNLWSCGGSGNVYITSSSLLYN
jgi:hypothetical protein